MIELHVEPIDGFGTETHGVFEGTGHSPRATGDFDYCVRERAAMIAGTSWLCDGETFIMGETDDSMMEVDDLDRDPNEDEREFYADEVYEHTYMGGMSDSDLCNEW